MATLTLNGIIAPTGVLLRARATIAGGTVAEWALAENVNADSVGLKTYGGSGTGTLTPDGPVIVEVRQVTAQTSSGFDHSTTVRAGPGPIGYAKSGVLLDFQYLDLAVSSITGGGGNAGNGAFAIAVNVTDGTTGIGNANVTLDGGAVLARGITDATGAVALTQDAGTTAIYVTKGGYAAYSGTQAISGNATIDVTLSPIIVPPPPSTNQATVYLYCDDVSGNVQGSVVIQYQVYKVGTAGALAFPGTWATATSNTNGLVTMTMLVGREYRIRRDSGEPVLFTPTQTGSVPLPVELLGRLQS